MYLKSLELSGFKSFAKKSELFFNSSISSIVGPNGSGKSNIAEAFRFVLGEQSMKSMRGKKTEDLIYNGGDSQTRSNRASVKLVFDNTKRLLGVDFDEVTIERVIHRDSLSEYFINGTQVRLKDVIELLAGAHIGSSGHHMISQGEADRILNANPKERRGMIEDALGLRVYQYKRDESARKLDKATENMKQVESLRKEIAPHIKFLKKQVEKVEKTIALREELTESYREYLKREELYLKDAKIKIEKEKEIPFNDSIRLEKEYAEAKAVLEQSQKKDQKSEEIIAIENNLRALRQDKDTLSRDMGRIEGEIGSLKRMIEKALIERNREDTRTVPLKEVESLLSRISRAFSGENFDLENIKKLVSEVKEMCSSFIERYKTGEVEDTTSGLEEEIALLSSKKTTLEAQVKDVLSKEADETARYRVVQADIEKEKDSSRDAERALFRIVSLQNEVRAQLSLVKMREEKLKLEEADFEREKTEGAVLIGRSVYLFEHSEIKNAEGVVLSDTLLLTEPRSVQEDRRKNIEKLKIRLEDAGVISGEETLKEYKEVSERDEFLAKEIVDLEKSIESLSILIKELEVKVDTLFREGVEKINKQFGEFFALMFGGGSASLAVTKEKKRTRKPSAEELELLGGVLPEEDESEDEVGVGIEVNLPRKKVKGLEMLSGGERALTSIALLFAMSQVNPPPFIILDETDAALDEANSKKYGDMIENLSKVSQLIVITHNRETMSRAGVLYGVTMGKEGYSKLLSIAFDEAVAVAK